MKVTVIILMICVCSQVEARPLNIVGTSWPPYEMLLDGGQEGLATEISFYVLDALGVKAELQLLPWKRAILQVENGTADAIISISRSVEREVFLNYPETFLHTSKYVFFKQKNEIKKITALIDVTPYRIGVTLGYSYTKNLWKLLNKHLNYDTVLSDEMNLKKLALGRIDFFPCDLANCLYIMKKIGLQSEISFDNFILTEKKYYLAFSKASNYPDLSKISLKFSSALFEFKKTKEHQKIEDKFLKRQ